MGFLRLRLVFVDGVVRVGISCGFRVYAGWRNITSCGFSYLVVIEMRWLLCGFWIARQFCVLLANLVWFWV